MRPVPPHSISNDLAPCFSSLLLDQSGQGELRDVGQRTFDGIGVAGASEHVRSVPGFAAEGSSLLIEERRNIEGTELLALEAIVGKTEFRKALSCFATGIAILTTRDDRDRSCAMTVNTLTSVSLDPPLILYCLGKSAFHFDAFSRAEAFAINMLRNDQQALSDRFAREQDDDLADLRITSLVTGSPILADHLTVLDCTTHARHEAGDHIIVLGQVRAIKNAPKADPLLYFKSQYRSLRPSAVD